MLKFKVVGEKSKRYPSHHRRGSEKKIDYFENLNLESLQIKKT